MGDTGLVFGLLDNQGQAVDANLELIGSSNSLLTKQADGWLLELRESNCVVKATGLEHKPVVSFLRGFSAPVRVQYDRSDTELAVLVEHDSDGFVRWDAMMSLWLPLFADEIDVPNTTLDLVGEVAHLAQAQLGNVEQTL